MSGRTVILYANNQNIGDLLSALGIKSLIDKRAHMFPFERRSKALHRLLSGLGANDTLIIGGGGLLKVGFDKLWHQIVEKQAKNQFRSILWGIGYCDVVGEHSRGHLELHREVVYRSVASTFRDETSYEAFSDLPNSQLIGCPSVVAIRDIKHDHDHDHSKRNGRPELLQVDHPGLLSAISLELSVDATAEVTSACSKWARAHGLSHRRYDNRIEPVALMPRPLVARLGASSLETWLARQRVESILSSVYDPSEVVVTSRLHGAIIACALDKKVVALSGDSKIRDFFAMVGLLDFLVEEPSGIFAALDRVSDQPSARAAIDRIVLQNKLFSAGLQL